MSELWTYNSDSNDSIKRIYLTSISSTYYGKKYCWSIVFNDGLKYNLYDKKINNYNLTKIDKKALEEAKNNSNKLKLHNNYFIKLIKSLF